MIFMESTNRFEKVSGTSYGVKDAVRAYQTYELILMCV
jgi:hypothetical protein